MDENNDQIKMCWIDMEGTGLDPYEDVPLEIGLKLTDEYGFVIAEAEWLIYEEGEQYDSAIERAKAHPIVGPMHEASGLWDAFAELETPMFSRADTDEEIMDWLDEHGVKYGTLPMCGSSIGSYDRPFANVHFPQFSRKGLNYRNIDVSSVKEICKMVNPVLYKNLEPIIGTKADSEHRVLSDIDASITEYRAYLDNFFFVGD